MNKTCLVMSADDRMCARLVAALLRNGFAVQACGSSFEALLRVGDGPVSAVLCDLAGMADEPLVVVRMLRGNDVRRAPLVFTLGGTPVDPCLAVHIDRATPAAWISARIARVHANRSRSQTRVH